MCASFAAAVAGNGSAGLELAQKAHDASAGATERLCALCASGLAQLTAGRPVESLATLQDFNRLAREAGFLAFLVVSEVPEAAARAFAGDPAGAIAALEASITRFTNWHNARIVAWAHLVLGQIYLAAASAEKPSGELSSSDQSGSLVKAEHHLVEAAATARTAAVKGFLLQALTTMADATLGPFKGAERAISLADARSIAVEIGAIPVVEHIDAIASNQGLAPAGTVKMFERERCWKLPMDVLRSLVQRYLLRRQRARTPPRAHVDDRETMRREETTCWYVHWLSLQ